ncbi:MAG: NADH:quinone oxidoreductase, partial [Methylobacter sp.]
QPYNCAHHPVLKERIITVAICLLLIGTGFYTTPWLNFIDQDAAAIGRQFPMHGTQPPDDTQVQAPIEDAGTKDGQHE